QRMCLFEPTSAFLIDAPNRTRGVCKPGELCVVESIKTKYVFNGVYGDPTTRKSDVMGLLPADEWRRTPFLHRRSWECCNSNSYLTTILPSLLLGCRVRDFEQNCVVVEQLRPLTLSMPPQKGLEEVPRYLHEGTYELGGSNPMLKIELKSTTGEIFDVLSKRIHVKKGEKQWTVVCYQEPLPSKVVIGSQL
ncbi:hypothetical protein PMAYCL1PPCAC_09541, partial [Pristionchus mayeri]